MLPPRSRFRSGQDRATESILPKNRNLTIFWTFYQPTRGPAQSHFELDFAVQSFRIGVVAAWGVGGPLHFPCGITQWLGIDSLPDRGTFCSR
jgi:hypothetical protein